MWQRSSSAPNSRWLSPSACYVRGRVTKAGGPACSRRARRTTSSRSSPGRCALPQQTRNSRSSSDWAVWPEPFDRVASADGDARGLFSEEPAAAYSAAPGNDVRVDAVQPAVQALLAANLVMRLGHGRYGISGPFVQRTWLERKESGFLNGPDAAWAPTSTVVQPQAAAGGCKRPSRYSRYSRYRRPRRYRRRRRARPPRLRSFQSSIASRSTARAALTFVAR